MNEFKKSLIDVAGDLSGSEDAVKNAILHKQPPKKKAKIGYYLMPVVIVTVFLFASQLFIPKILDISQAKQTTNVDLFEFLTAFEERQGDTEVSRANGYYEMVRVIGIPKYAKSIGITITDKDRQLAKSLLGKLWTEKDFAKVIASANITKKDFDENIAPLLIERVAYAEKLEEKMFRDYTKMVPAIASSYTDFMGLSYMEAHYEAQLDQFKKQHNIVTSSNESLGTSGAVVAVVENMFLMIQNMTIQEYEQLSFRIFVDKFAAWFMNDPQKPVEVGDYIYLKETLISVDRIGIEKAGVGLHNGLEILLPNGRTGDVKEIALTEPVHEEFYENYAKATLINEQAIEITKVPVYIVQIEGKSYTVWQNDEEQLYILPFGKKEFATFTKSTSKKMLTLFQNFDNE